jgi:hypothetical protein|uniref:Uncharacterized protein n=1 Tax=Myoviridae sp. ctcyQ27 TaxID=2825139 RepID=A0A8S5UFB3_9CAUD|nr:MAG TPA: hypothetical protein [Myoviridae sp. ctcyQ27]
MFFESILEEVNIDEPVSESTMEEIRQLSIPNFMESALSPFDLVDKGIYENAKAYNDMVSKISKIELNYLRENGEEPVWEASDHQSIFARFIAGIKHIIQVIAGAFQKLIKSIDDMITNRYKKLGAEFVKQMQSAEIRGVDLSNKTFTLIKYEPEVGIRLLHNAENVQGNINKVDAYKKAWSYVFTGESTRSSEGLKEVEGNAVDSLRKVLFNHSAIDTSKLNSNAAARDALRSAMCPARGSASFGEAMYYVKAYRADPRAQKLKAGLKQMYQRINKVLGKQIDVAKSLQKSIDGKKEPVPSQVTGSIVSGLNAYSSMVTSIYNETVRCASKRWSQSCTLTSKLLKSAKGELKGNAKEQKSAAKDMKNFDKDQEKKASKATKENK